MTTNSAVTAAMTTSARLLRESDRHWSGSMSFDAANTITAPRIAEGRYWIGPVRKIRMTAIIAAATSPLTWLVAPMSSFTADREPLVPTGMPLVNPDAIWGEAERQELLVGVDGFVVTGSEGAGGEGSRRRTPRGRWPPPIEPKRLDVGARHVRHPERRQAAPVPTR
ncbi:MAG: hypothetical protein M5U19_02520 [Microthrixaceae bacterium]|nr:hypothetical protein [Microthrixaceae bacterium]